MQTITRRQFLEMALGIPCLYATPLLAASAGGSRFQGCFLRSGSENFLDKLKLLSSSGDKEVDQVCSAAERELRREFRVAPDTWFFDDGDDPNAFAIPFLSRSRTVLSQWDSKGDGTVCLGRRLVWENTRRNELNRLWKTRLTMLMAHEWAHVVQFSRGYRAPGKSVELHADFLAGWFLGRTTGARESSPAMQRQEAYRIWKYADNDIHGPAHHGTIGERMNAIDSGFELAAKVGNVDGAFRARSLNG
jgi:hypothetical protein